MSSDALRLLVPALNQMMDVTTARAVALHTYLPPLILLLLVSVALLSGLLAGYAMARRKKRSGMHMFLYAAAVALTVDAILDLDQPRSGLIRLTAADQALEQLKDSIP
jgi:FtsH-binding integral membrane protein